MRTCLSWPAVSHTVHEDEFAEEMGHLQGSARTLELDLPVRQLDDSSSEFNTDGVWAILKDCI